jgi:aspartate carbamoyltransferase catalytic subunit
MAWTPRMSITSVRQFDRGDLDELFRLTERIRQDPPAFRGLAAPYVLATLFYEPSTRTRLSFEAAMARLGGHVISTENAAEMSSAVKGETLADTVRIVSGYADVIALRHYEAGASDVAARAARVPVINAGDGAGEHPTQALLDAFTVAHYRGGLDDLVITFVGDLAYGRTVHSLALLLTRFRGVRIRFVAPERLAAPAWLVGQLEAAGIDVRPVPTLADAAAESDVLYVTRVQTERFPSGLDPADTTYTVEPDVLDRLPPHALILHPLPRVQELPPVVDADPRARYFEQAAFGLYVRMALLGRALGVL